MTSGSPRPDGKILIIGGGIANFTNVAATFKVIDISIIMCFEQLCNCVCHFYHAPVIIMFFLSLSLFLFSGYCKSS